MAKSEENDIKYRTLAKSLGGHIMYPPSMTLEEEKESKYYKCVVIGETETDVKITVPPGQARDFENFIVLHSDGVKPKGKFEWNYSVVKTKGNS